MNNWDTETYDTSDDMYIHQRCLLDFSFKFAILFSKPTVSKRRFSGLGLESTVSVC